MIGGYTEQPRHPGQLGALLIGYHEKGVLRFAGKVGTLIRRFPDGVLYLAPEPDEPFRQLVLAFCDRYPGTPPYGGKWPDIVPHLSVAWIQDEQRCDRIADDFTRAARGKLPIAATAAEVTLMEKRSGHWHMYATFGLRV